MRDTFFGTKIRKGQRLKLSNGNEIIEMKFAGINSLNELQISIKAPESIKIEKIKQQSRKVRTL